MNKGGPGMDIEYSHDGRIGSKRQAFKTEGVRADDEAEDDYDDENFEDDDFIDRDAEDDTMYSRLP